MDGRLDGKRVAILAADGFERIELDEPRRALEEAGATVEVVSLGEGEIQGFDGLEPAGTAGVDRAVEEVAADDYDALLIPGGVGNPDRLRGDENAVAFVRDLGEQGKPLAVICHGPWMLVESGLARGRTLTSWPTLRTDVENAGGTWVDREVVDDDGIVTSRAPGDIPAFNATMIEQFAAGPRGGRRIVERSMRATF